MKRTLVTVLGSTALLVAVSPVARADAFLSISDGTTSASCNNSTALGVTNCGLAGFSTSLGSSLITFNGGTFGGYTVAKIDLVGTAGPTTSQLVDTKTTIQHVSAVSTALTILFAVNQFATPPGSPLIFSASHSGTFANGNAGQGEAFIGWGNSANTLGAGPGNGVPDVAPDCLDPTGGTLARSCSGTGVPTTFTRAGNFAMNGREIITLTANTGSASFTGTTTATATPEPGSLVLLGSGLFGLVGVRGVFRRRTA